MQYDIGSLVRARGREWVVLPKKSNDPETLIVRPLGGTDDEITGIYCPIEDVEPAKFRFPDPQKDMGNHLSCSLLRDAVRLGFRSGAGPFRSLARIAIDPRPYQLIPLLMALKLDPIRILIADDVGIGKTIEACLIARELLDRGEISGLAVLCPPHLAEQWQRALEIQFHIKSELVLSGTASRLDRTRNHNQSLFERYPFTVVSTDYIKSDRHRNEFIRSCPDLVIVDEAHTCTTTPGRSVNQQRHALLRDLTNPDEKKGAIRHMVLVTATPHSGNKDTFHSLLSILDRKFIDFPSDLSGMINKGNRETLAKHFVQRRRADLRSYLETETPFPERETAENHYTLSKEHRQFFDKILAYCRESVNQKGIEEYKQRVRWWSALALLRCLSSSPIAAESTLRNRSTTLESKSVDEINQEGRRTILDLEGENTEENDFTPGSDVGDMSDNERKRLLKLANEARKFAGKKDAKLVGLKKIVKEFIEDGYSPIVFCKFIPTVEYVAEHLRKEFLPSGVEIEDITSQQTPKEREKSVFELGKSDKRVLVCTDCLSEGINLQHMFDAVIHYDLSWIPTRHEQRDGRVDRFNQPKKIVRTLTYYGKDNPVDGIVLEVLLKKHQAIQNQLGIAVPLPTNTDVIEKAIYEGLLLRDHIDPQQLTFEFLDPYHKEVAIEWEKAVEREKVSRTIFAQNKLLKKLNEEIISELEEVRSAIGQTSDIKNFTTTTLKTLGAIVSGEDPIEVNLEETPKALRDALGVGQEFKATFSNQSKFDTNLLTRTHPIVEGLASYTIESAFNPHKFSPARRCNVIRTKGVQVRTTLFLVRFRFHINSLGRDDKIIPLFAEDIELAAISRSPDKAEWLTKNEAEKLLELKPDENIDTNQAEIQIERILGRIEKILPLLNEIADNRGKELCDAHRRVRATTSADKRSINVNVNKPVDILGVYIFLPVSNGDEL